MKVESMGRQAAMIKRIPAAVPTCRAVTPVECASPMLAEFVTVDGVPVNPLSKTPIPWHITRRPIIGRSGRFHFALLSLSMATPLPMLPTAEIISMTSSGRTAPNTNVGRGRSYPSNGKATNGWPATNFSCSAPNTPMMTETVIPAAIPKATANTRNFSDAQTEKTTMVPRVAPATRKAVQSIMPSL